MAIYVVEIKLPYERISSLFAVMHSNTDTMFTPTFSEEDELIAHMFAAEYSGPHGRWRDYSESAQHNLVADLRMFLAEVFPHFSESRAQLPTAWHMKLLENYYCDDESPELDAADLLNWYQDGDSRADVAQYAFYAWRKARQVVSA